MTAYKSREKRVDKNGCVWMMYDVYCGLVKAYTTPTHGREFTNNEWRAMELVENAE